jgi:hypothetical protein
MTPQQITLARHALGLPNRQNTSYRNKYSAGKGHSSHAAWEQMVKSGAATVTRHAGGLGGQDTFSMTQDGAKAALQPGESLCAEDFPGVPDGQ